MPAALEQGGFSELGLRVLMRQQDRLRVSIAGGGHLGVEGGRLFRRARHGVVRNRRARDGVERGRVVETGGGRDGHPVLCGQADRRGSVG